jgi:hypothetical protein
VHLLLTVANTNKEAIHCVAATSNFLAIQKDALIVGTNTGPQVTQKVGPTAIFGLGLEALLALTLLLSHLAEEILANGLTAWWS